MVAVFCFHQRSSGESWKNAHDLHVLSAHDPQERNRRKSSTVFILPTAASLGHVKSFDRITLRLRKGDVMTQHSMGV